MPITGIATYLTAALGIVAAYVTFRYQQRLKAFELFLQRRDAVLSQVEATIRLLQESARDTTPTLESSAFMDRQFVDDGLVLFHKIKGADFGPSVDSLANAYYSVVTERYFKHSTKDLHDIRHRALNLLTLLYGLAHSSMSREIGSLSFSIGRQLRRYWERRQFRKIPNDRKSA